MADEDAALAVLRELWPVGGDGCLEIELAAVGEHEHAQGRHRRGAGVDVDDRVTFPRAAVAGGETGPEINHRLAIHRHGYAGAELTACVKVCGESVAYRFEGGVACAVGLDVMSFLPWRRAAPLGFHVYFRGR